MAWVQVGTHKINTAVICYVDQEGDTVRIYFHGEWDGNPLDLHFDEAKALWRYLKAEDLMMVKDKGSAAVMPKLRASGMYDVHSSGAAPTSVDKPKPAVSVSTGSGSGSNSSGHSSSSSHSHSHSQKHEKHSHSDRHAEHKKH